MRRVLLIGAGRAREQSVHVNGLKSFDGAELVTLDYNSEHSPDIVADLEVLPYSWGQSHSYNEIHAYEVLEHTGSQGDWKFFFGQFSEFHRLLVPGGYLAATVPNWKSKWAWGDPSHKRVINECSLVFLSQAEYSKQIGKTAMSDFRFCYKADFSIQYVEYEGEHFKFLLRAE